MSQAPTQRPPQPSSAPQGVVGVQVVAQKHRPTTQRSRAERLHGGSHAQVSMQRPATQRAVPGQLTPAQGLDTQRPSTHTSVSPHPTPSQLERGRHSMWQAWSGSQRPAQGRIGAQAPRESSQNWPAGQVMPEHGAG